MHSFHQEIIKENPCIFSKFLPLNNKLNCDFIAEIPNFTQS